MQDTSSRIRYLLVYASRVAGVVLVVASLFLAYTWLTVERWAMGYEYLAWIFGFGIAGVILLLVTWKQKHLISRPHFGADRYALAIVSGATGIVLVVANVLDLLTVGINGATLLMCAMWPALAILTFVSIVYFFVKHKDSVRLAILPLVLNLVALTAAVMIWQIGPSLELSFRWRLRGYTEVVNLVEQEQIQPDERGYASLPSRYEYLSDGGRIKIFGRGEFTSVLFFNTLGILGEYSAYVYRSDDTLPRNYLEDGCDRAWRVKTNVPNWFLCVSD